MKSSKPFVERYVKQLSLRLVLLLMLFFAAIFLFGAIIHEVLWEKETEADYWVFRIIAAHLVSPDLTAFMRTVSFFASSTFLQIAYPAIIALYLLQRDWKRALEIAVVGTGGYLVNYSMKLFFHRPRPDHPLIAPPQTFSFPSGHAMSGFIFYGLLAYLVWKSGLSNGVKYLLIALLIFFALLIGFSRVYLRAHYTSDVVAGFCIGSAWLLLSIGIMERQKKRVAAELEPGEKMRPGS